MKFPSLWSSVSCGRSTATVWLLLLLVQLLIGTAVEGQMSAGGLAMTDQKQPGLLFRMARGGSAAASFPPSLREMQLGKTADTARSKDSLQKFLSLSKEDLEKAAKEMPTEELHAHISSYLDFLQERDAGSQTRGTVGGHSGRVSSGGLGVGLGEELLKALGAPGAAFQGTPSNVAEAVLQYLLGTGSVPTGIRSSGIVKSEFGAGRSWLGDLPESLGALLVELAKRLGRHFRTTTTTAVIVTTAAGTTTTTTTSATAATTNTATASTATTITTTTTTSNATTTATTTTTFNGTQDDRDLVDFQNEFREGSRDRNGVRSAVLDLGIPLARYEPSLAEFMRNHLRSRMLLRNCTLEHSSEIDRTNIPGWEGTLVGENLYERSALEPIHITAEEVASAWYGEIGCYLYGPHFDQNDPAQMNRCLNDLSVGCSNCKGEAAASGSIEAFTQMMWQSSIAMGCARVTCPPNDDYLFKSIVGCIYGPAGNVVSAVPFSPEAASLLEIASQSRVRSSIRRKLET